MAALPGSSWPRLQLYRVTVSTAGHHATCIVGGLCYTRAMPTDDPFPTPTRIEPRGEPPEHGDRVRPVPYPLAEARAAARDRLNLWLAQHPGHHPGGHGQWARDE